MSFIQINLHFSVICALQKHLDSNSKLSLFPPEYKHIKKAIVTFCLTIMTFFLAIVSLCLTILT